MPINHSLLAANHKNFTLGIMKNSFFFFSVILILTSVL